MNLVEIGARIKAYRKSIGISQERLAEMINVSLSEQLSKMDEEQRTRAESAFKALLPYIK